MFLNILDKQRINLLAKLASDDIVRNHFYLGGGTALSLQLGLRKSYDFDFFSEQAFNAEALYAYLAKYTGYEISALNINHNTCDLQINGIQVSFFQYPYPLAKQTIRVKEFSGLNLASAEDIAAMKLSAIGNRGAKKDFFDLYFIYQKGYITTEKLLNILYQKYGTQYNFTYMGMGLQYFNDAEQQSLPDSFVPYDWKQIKSFFANEADQFLYLYQQHDQISTIAEIESSDNLSERKTINSSFIDKEDIARDPQVPSTDDYEL